MSRDHTFIFANHQFAIAIFSTLMLRYGCSSINKHSYTELERETLRERGRRGPPPPSLSLLGGGGGGGGRRGVTPGKDNI